MTSIYILPTRTWQVLNSKGKYTNLNSREFVDSAFTSIPKGSWDIHMKYLNSLHC
jgi:hypothetical protein